LHPARINKVMAACFMSSRPSDRCDHASQRILLQPNLHARVIVGPQTLAKRISGILQRISYVNAGIRPALLPSVVDNPFDGFSSALSSITETLRTWRYVMHETYEGAEENKRTSGFVETAAFCLRFRRRSPRAALTHSLRVHLNRDVFLANS